MGLTYSGACVRMISDIEGAIEGLLDFGIVFSLPCVTMSFIIWSIVGLAVLCESELVGAVELRFPNWPDERPRRMDGSVVLRLGEEGGLVLLELRTLGRAVRGGLSATDSSSRPFSFCRED